MSSLHLCCHWTQVTQTRTEVQVDCYWWIFCREEMIQTTRRSLNLHLCSPSLCLSYELGLHHHSHHPPDTAAADIEWSLLLQTVWHTVRVRNKANDYRPVQVLIEYKIKTIPTITNWNVSFGELCSIVIHVSQYFPGLISTVDLYTLGSICSSKKYTLTHFRT